MKLGIFTPPASMTNIEALRQTAQAGFKGFEPFAAHELAKPDINAARNIRKEAERIGLHMPCLSVGIDVTYEGAVDALKGFAECAAEMGIKYLHHTIYPYLDPAHAETEFKPLLQSAAAAAGVVFDYAETLGVRCIYENQGFVFNGLNRFSAFLECLDRPAGVVLDAGNIAFVGEDADAFAERFADRIVHVHVKDYRKTAVYHENGFRLADGTGLVLANLLEGDMKLAEAADILRKHRYDGWYMLECSPISDGYAEQKLNMERLEKLLMQETI